MGIAQIDPKKKIALVCSGGGIKAGAFHLGVALALQEKGFKFLGGRLSDPLRRESLSNQTISTYVGSSAGAMIASYLTAGYSLDEILNSFLNKAIEQKDLINTLPRLTYQKIFTLIRGKDFKSKFKLYQKINFLNLFKSENFLKELMDWNWIKMNGIFSTYGIEKYIREDVMPVNDFDSYLADLFIVATQIDIPRKVVFGKYDHSYFQKQQGLNPACFYNRDIPISQACAASVALPFMFVPHAISHAGQTHYYIDGEVRDTLSTHVAVDAGADLIIASYTHQPYCAPSYGPQIVDAGLPAILTQALYLLVEQKINAYKKHQNAHLKAIQAVSHYCKAQGLSEKHRKSICALLEKKLSTSSRVDTVYIHPPALHSKMFFGEHFSFSKKKLMEFVQSGFTSASETLKKYQFNF